MSITSDKKSKILTVGCYLLLICCVISVIIQMYKDGIWHSIDAWYMIPTGNDILSNGIPYTNKYATLANGVEGKPAIIVQQWLYCVIVTIFHNIFGMKTGLILLSALQCLTAISFTIFAMRKLSNKTLPYWTIAITFSVCVYTVCEWTFQPRPTTCSFLILMNIVLILEHYKETQNKKILIALPPLTLLHANLHAALAPASLAVIFLYVIIESVSNKKLDKTLLIGAAISTVATLLTPYGYNSILYSFLSYGAASYGNIISEMRSILDAGSQQQFIFIINTFMVILAFYCAIKNKPYKYELIIICIIAYLAGAHNMRSLWMTTPCALLLIASTPANQALKKLFEHKDMFILCTILAITLPLITCTAYSRNTVDFNTIVQENNDVCTIIRDSGEDGAIAVFESGCYLEYNNLKTTSDSRPEIWESNITKTEAHSHKDLADFVAPLQNIVEHNDTSDATYNAFKHNLAHYLSNYDYSYCVITSSNTQLQCYRQAFEELDWSEIYNGQNVHLWKRPIQKTTI